MTEVANGDDLSLRNAVSEIEKAVRFEEPLRQRTEGITWMIYGLATAAIFLSYHALSASLPHPHPWWTPWAFGTLWAPWIAAAVVTTIMLWESAALAAPRIVEDEPSGWIVTAAWVLAVGVAFGGSFLLPDSVPEPAFFLLWVGATWAALGAANVYKSSGTGRRMSIVIGFGTALVGLALALSTTSYNVATVVATATGLLFPLLGGGWQASRG